MKSQPAEISHESHPTHDEFATYPLHKLVSVFSTSEEMDAALEELNANGFSADVIEAYCGIESGRRNLAERAKAGIWDSFLTAIHHLGPDRTYIERYERHLDEGHCVIMVTVTNKLRKERAARILHNHTKERVTYFGLLSANEIK